MKKATVFLAIISICLTLNVWANNPITVNLANQLKIDIPAQWVVFDKHEVKTLESMVNTAINNSQIVIDGHSTHISFVAGLYDNAGDRAKVIIRNYPDSQFTQQHTQNKQFLKDFEEGLKEGAVKSTKAAGIKILSWGKGYKQNIAGKIAFINTYRRSAYPGQKGKFSVKLIRFFDGPNTLSITISYNEIEKSSLEPTCNAILKSLRFIQ